MGCAAGAVVTLATAFTAAECGAFAALYNALGNVDEQQGVPSASACTTDDCNGLLHVVMDASAAVEPPIPANLSKRDRALLLTAVVCGVSGLGLALLIITALLLRGHVSTGTAARGKHPARGRRPGSSVRGIQPPPPPPPVYQDDYEYGGAPPEREPPPFSPPMRGPPPPLMMNSRRNILYDQGAAGSESGYGQGDGSRGSGGAPRGYGTPPGRAQSGSDLGSGGPDHGGYGPPPNEGFRRGAIGRAPSGYVGANEQRY